MEGANFGEELHGEYFQHLNSSERFPAYPTSMDPCVVREPRMKSIAEAASSSKRNGSGKPKLSDEFTALAAIVPGTEEMDEISVLEGSIRYMRQLQARVETLEEQNRSGSGICTGDDNFSYESLPQIEARVSDRNVLIRIHCELCKGVLVKALEETEKLHLTVVNSSAIQFGPSTLDITIVAEMDDEVILTVKPLVKSLRSSLIQFVATDLLPHDHEHDK